MVYPGYETKDGICWGRRQPEVLEIKFHDSRTKNSITHEGYLALGKLVHEAQSDESIRVIFIHGGSFFSAGNNLMDWGKDPHILEPDRWYSKVLSLNHYAILTCTMAIKNSVKPIVGLVRGKAVGIGFTILSLFTFVYCTEEAKFIAPFSTSFQIPEGSSSYNFPRIFGQRKANELLFLSKELTA